MPDSYPAEDPRIIPAYRAPDGSVYIHQDLQSHIPAFALSEKMGDLWSWVAYIKTYGGALSNLLTWSERGFKAKLDYQTQRSEQGTWEATYAFEATPEWAAWQKFATGHGVNHKQAVEFLEDHAPEIVEPDAAGLLAILRTLRANVNTNAAAELRPDGTTHVSFERNQRVTAGVATEADLPPQFEIGIPIFAGDPNPWKLVVRVRVSVTSDSHLELRFSMPQSEAVLETIYGERVAKAQELLGDGYQLLRAAP